MKTNNKNERRLTSLSGTACASRVSIMALILSTGLLVFSGCQIWQGGLQSANRKLLRPGQNEIVAPPSRHFESTADLTQNQNTQYQNAQVRNTTPPNENNSYAPSVRQANQSNAVGGLGVSNNGAYGNSSYGNPNPAIGDGTYKVRYQSPEPNSGQGLAPPRQLPPNNNIVPIETMYDNIARAAEGSGNRDAANLVADVVIQGNQLLATHHIMRNIRTRPGRYFDPDRLQEDVDRLYRLPEIRRINGPYIERSANGIVVTMEIIERNRVRKVEFVGNRGITDRTLRKETDLNDGAPLDIHQIRMAKARIEDLYKEKGFPRTQVEILEGDKPEDADVVFLIHEDQKQRIWKAEFEGNEFATDARLHTFIKSKPGIAKIFGGLVNRDEIEQDILRLTNYYRKFGFFNARIGREISESNDGRWLTVRFIINEGPRYRVRNVAFAGNGAYTSEQLSGMLNLKPVNGELPDFNAAKMNEDVVALRDLYGSEGFVYSDIQAEPRFLEEPGMLDLVYKISEGEQYRVGKINVHIEGASGITRRQVALNRLSLRPGDKIDVRKIRESERRLGSASIFAGNQPGTTGQPPKIVVRPMEDSEFDRMAGRPGNSGGGTRR